MRPRCCEERLANLDREAEVSRTSPPDPGHTPPHALAMVDYWKAITSVERKWLVGLLHRIAAGELSFLDEPMDWTPADDDPGSPDA